MKKLEDLIKQWHKEFMNDIDAIARDYERIRKQEKFEKQDKFKWN